MYCRIHAGELTHFLFPSQRLEVLHGDAGGAAELGLILHWSVPVQDDQVSCQLSPDWLLDICSVRAEPHGRSAVVNKVCLNRWTKLRINMVPATVLEPVSECFLASLIIGWAAHHVFRYGQSEGGAMGLWFPWKLIS